MSGGGYQNSGLLRFGQNPYQGYNPGAAFPQYTTPAIFQSPYVPLQRPQLGGMFSGASSVAPQPPVSGGAGGSVGDPSTNAVSSTATNGTLGQLGQLGLAAMMGPAALGMAAANMGMSSNSAPAAVTGQAIGQTVGAGASDGSVGGSVGEGIGAGIGAGDGGGGGGGK